MNARYSIASSILNIPSECQMIEAAGPTAIGSNQVTALVPPGQNINGLILLSLYTQVIQTGSPGNLAQSLIMAAATAPVDFASKVRCFPIYRTFQSEKQSPVALGGFAPMNVAAIQIPARWGIWQVLNVVGAALDRNNMRAGIVIL
jgi:hypothetical protein